MTTPYHVQVLINVTLDETGAPVGFFGYKPGHVVATDDRCAVTVSAHTALEAAEQAFAVGNREAVDDTGKQWSPDIRSVSVGDVLHVHNDHSVNYLACASTGWNNVEPPADIAGTAGLVAGLAARAVPTQLEPATKHRSGLYADAPAFTGLVVHPDATWELREFTGDPAEMSAIVGGWLEMITGRGWSCYVDEEGKLSDKPINTLANALTHWPAVSRGDFLVGTAVIVGYPDDEGYDTSVDMTLFANELGAP